MTLNELYLLKAKAESAAQHPDEYEMGQWLSEHELKANALLRQDDAAFIAAIDPGTFIEVVSKAILYERARISV